MSPSFTSMGSVCSVLIKSAITLPVTSSSFKSSVMATDSSDKIGGLDIFDWLKFN